MWFRWRLIPGRQHVACPALLTYTDEFSRVGQSPENFSCLRLAYCQDLRDPQTGQGPALGCCEQQESILHIEKIRRLSEE
jgi:hypothetical protein